MKLVEITHSWQNTKKVDLSCSTEAFEGSGTGHQNDPNHLNTTTPATETGFPKRAKEPNLHPEFAVDLSVGRKG